MAKSNGFTLAGVGIFITYIICMWMLAMVRDVQVKQTAINQKLEHIVREMTVIKWQESAPTNYISDGWYDSTNLCFNACHFTNEVKEVTNACHQLSN